MKASLVPIILLFALSGCADTGVSGSSDASAVAISDQQAFAPQPARTFVAPEAGRASLVAEASPPQFGGATSDDGGRPQERPQYAYAHDISIAVAAKWVSAHFVALKKLCLEDVSLRCVLLDASISGGGQSRLNAHIQARLSHDGVERFTQAAAAPVLGEAPGDVVVEHSVTRIDDLGRPIADAERRQAQLETYRKRLEGLEGRQDIRAEDLIKIARELSQVQSRIEETTAQRRKLDERVETETVSIFIRSETPSGGPLSPIENVWRESANILARSTAGALRFILTMAPWVPVFALPLWLLWLLLCAWRRRQQG